MGYKGRIISASFMAIILLSVRAIVRSHFDAVPHPIPLPAIIPIVIGWYLGKRYDKSVFQANTDSLTGLFNRHYVLDNIQKIFSKTKRTKNELAIILLDVNNFKQINDNFGHKAGDRVLKTIAGLLEDSFTSKDVVSRWGGDEFLIVAPFADPKTLQQKITHFENSLKNLEGNTLKFPFP